MDKVLDDIMNKVNKMPLNGSTADYIPELKIKNKNDFGLAITDLNGEVKGFGKYLDNFTIQSVSKAIVYLYILETLGYEKIKKYIDLEPSGEAFNSFKLKESKKGYKAFNPMVNTGAIVATSLVSGTSYDERYENIKSFSEKVLGKSGLEIDLKVYNSEKKTGVTNFEIAKMLKDKKLIKGDIKNILNLYFKQCSFLVSARDLSYFGALLANDGLDPKSKNRLASKENIRYLKIAMIFSGLYDYSGKFFLKTGLIAKSGVGGGIIAFSPCKLGIGTFGPSLDIYGNSEKGVFALEKLSKELNLRVL